MRRVSPGAKAGDTRAAHGISHTNRQRGLGADDHKINFMRGGIGGHGGAIFDIQRNALGHVSNARVTWGAEQAGAFRILADRPS